MAKKKYKPRINKTKEVISKNKNLFWPGGPLETLAANPNSNNTIYVLSPEQETLLKEHNNSVSVPNMNKVRTVTTQNVAPILDEGPDLEQIDTSDIFKKTWGEQSTEAWNNAWKSKNIGSSLTSIAGGLTGITQSTIDNAKIKDTTGIQTAIDAAANTTFGGSTNEQLMAQYDAIEDLNRTSQRDLTGSVGSKLTNVGKATLSGVQAGMTIGGPIGGIVGGALGAISSGIGWAVGDTTAKNEAERLNREAEAAEQRRLANFDLAVNNLEQQNLMYDMANYAKYGGKIHIKPSKRGTFTRAAKSRGLGVQEFASKVLANPDNYSEAMRKKAQFARNFGSRKHSMGGYLVGQTYDISEQEYNRLIQLGYEIEVL